MMKESEFNDIFTSFTIPVKLVKDDDGSFVATNSVIEDVFSVGATKEEAISELCRNLIEYAQEYYENYDQYSTAPNRKKHDPYVLRILSSPSIEFVRSIITVADF